jgi:CYTH domain-containing protein
MEPPKYSRLEIERRWLVDLSGIDLTDAPVREIHDLYIAESRLRLRSVGGAEGMVFKLCKKYGRSTALSEPITNLYLTEREYHQFSALPGHSAHKLRYALPSGSLDVYLEPRDGLAIFEVEFPDEVAASRFEPPDFVVTEITGDPAFSGASIAASRAEP